MNCTIHLLFFLIFLLIIGNCKNEVKIFSSNEQENKSINKWDLPIEFHVAYSISGYGGIFNAIAAIQEYTCITFKYNSTEPIKGRHGLNFYYATTSESETIGMKNKSESQYVVLNWDGLTYKVTAQSFIHNALGIYYEMSRMNRDEFITVYNSNIRSDFVKYFNKTDAMTSIYNDSEMGFMDYNYGSINHFGMKDYNKNDNDTFSTRMFNELYRHMVGQKYETSFNDYKVLNRIYCKNEMKKCGKTCQNYGYPDPKNCKCRCPNGFVGNLCQNIEGVEKWHGIVYGTCGPVELKAEQARQHYRIKKQYNCFIQVKSTNPHRLVLLYNIYYFSYRGTPCVPGWEIEIRYRKDKGAMGLCLCGRNDVPFWMISDDDTIFIHFVGIYYWHYLAFYYRQYENGTKVDKYLVTD